MHLNPAELLIYRAKGVRKLSSIIEIDKSSIIVWKKSGLIPSKHQKMILDIMPMVTPREMIYGKLISNSAIGKSPTKFLLDA